MGTIPGYDGELDWGAIVDSDVVYRAHSWSLDVAGDTHDTTDFDSNGWREFTRGLNSWSGSIELYVDSTNQIVPSDVGSTATIKLYVNSTDYMHGQAICSGWHPATTVDGVATQSLDFQGTSDMWFTGG